MAGLYRGAGDAGGDAERRRINKGRVNSQKTRPGEISGASLFVLRFSGTARGQFRLAFTLFRMASATMLAAPSIPVWQVLSVR